MYKLNATKRGDNHPDHMYITFQADEGDVLSFEPINELDPALIVCILKIEDETVSLLSIANKNYVGKSAKYYNKQKNKTFSFVIIDNVVLLA